MSDISDGQIAYDIENITQKNDWVAIIHADGNGLGRMVKTKLISKISPKNSMPLQQQLPLMLLSL